MKLHHIGIHVRSLEKSVAFYVSHFGFHEEIYFEWDGEKIAFLQSGHIRLELIQNDVQEHGLTSGSHFALEVENLEEKKQELTEQGILSLEGPYLIRDRWKVIFYPGPDGEVIELVEPLFTNE
ncbi:VOC family protein [Rossellomorea sp. AcN35-11]|nr:VOC family protein [Rossellomorea aquimaris]WJV30615.1 VOC family protein [Rossellomorea sp. AcN35-11]